MKQTKIKLSQESLKNLEEILNKMVTSNEEPFSPENFNERKDEFYKKFLPKSDSTYQNFHPLDGLDENFRQLKQVDTTVPPKSFIGDKLEKKNKTNFDEFMKNFLQKEENIKSKLFENAIEYYILLPNVLKENLIIKIEEGFIKVNYRDAFQIDIFFKPDKIDYKIKIESNFDIENITTVLSLGVLNIHVPYKSVNTENFKEIEIL